MGLIGSLFSVLLWAVPSLTFVLILSLLGSDINKWYRLPPGPLPIPFIGNLYLLFGLPKARSWYKFVSLHEKYGPIYTFWVGRSPWIFVSDPAIGHELCSVRGSKYSSRPSTYYHETFTGGSSIVMSPYDPSYLISRKLFQSALQPAALASFKHRQEAEATRLAWNVLNNPQSWHEEYFCYVVSIGFGFGYGRRVDNLDSKIASHRISYTTEASDLLRPGRYLGDTYTTLKLIPEFLTPWVKVIRDKGDRVAEFDKLLIEISKKDVEANEGSDRRCLAETIIHAYKNNEPGLEHLTERQVNAIPGVAFSGAVETTAITMYNAMLALITNPHVLSAAHKELDEVVGDNQSPGFSHRAKLPYIDAILQETLRWRPAVVINPPHTSTEDDIYEGYHIPKGTSVMANHWAMNKHPTYFPSPHLFLPERHLSPTHPLHRPSIIGKKFPGRWSSAGFGFGRRACIGADLAEHDTFIALAKLIWAFEIEGIEGEVYDVDGHEGVLLVKPKEFECAFRVRSEKHKEVLEREIVGAREVLEKFPVFEDSRKIRIV